ncbi:glycosyltransferase [Pseudoalteromonas sp. P1-11]|uniref:glycosyltransferase n=1 Tax=Pseudoalteromonas sp. P1-11 TaxID=1715254 RepID=UPI0006DC43C9|nr:glycosyltransferase [Pseudoalteromonas sp. P1-11]KPW01776.1 Glycosyltransferase Gtf1 [Pseudoalteromonas sp. P1-11]
MASKSKILWVNAPLFNKNQGVFKYSEVIINLINSRLDGNVQELFWTGKKGVYRHLWEFLILPFIVLLKSFSFNKIVLYQESIIYLLLFSIFFKDRVVVIHHFPDMKTTGTLVSRIKVMYLKFNFMLLKLPLNYKVLVPTISTKNDLLNNSTVHERDVFVIPNLFDFSITPVERSGRVDDEHAFVKILNVGSDEPRKSLKTIVKALSELNNQCDKNFIFVRAGKIVDKKSHESTLQLAREKNVKLKYFDEPSDSELKKLYLDCDIYVSASEHEGFGRTVIEAQLASLPVVATAIPAHEEVLQGSASLFSVGNHKQLTQCVLKILDTGFKRNLIKKGKVNSSRYLPINSENVIKKVFFDG